MTTNKKTRNGAATRVVLALASLVLLAPARLDAADAGAPSLHTSFVFLTQPVGEDGSAGEMSYTDNLSHSMTVTTSFLRWTCFRSPVVINARGSWAGSFSCANASGDMAMLVLECSPKKLTPMYVQTMLVTEQGLGGKTFGMQFIGGCSTETTVPLRGEVRR